MSYPDFEQEPAEVTGWYISPSVAREDCLPIYEAVRQAMASAAIDRIASAPQEDIDTEFAGVVRRAGVRSAGAIVEQEVRDWLDSDGVPAGHHLVDELPGVFMPRSVRFAPASSPEADLPCRRRYVTDTPLYYETLVAGAWGGHSQDRYLFIPNTISRPNRVEEELHLREYTGIPNNADNGGNPYFYKYEARDESPVGAVALSAATHYVPNPVFSTGRLN